MAIFLTICLTCFSIISKLLVLSLCLKFVCLACWSYHQVRGKSFWLSKKSASRRISHRDPLLPRDQTVMKIDKANQQNTIQTRLLRHRGDEWDHLWNPILAT